MQEFSVLNEFLSLVQNKTIGLYVQRTFEKFRYT